MTRMVQLHRIYINTLYCAEKTLKQNNQYRLQFSYYNISGMDETKLLDNLEYLSSIIRPPKEYYNKKS